MKRLCVAAGLSLLAGCPYDADAAGLQVADGGVIVPIAGLDGGFLLPNVDLNSARPLRQLPDRKTLCKLVIGDFYGRTDYPRWVGSWMADIRSASFLGEPPKDGLYIGPDDASLRYTYLAPGESIEGQPKTISIKLGLEYIAMLDLSQPTWRSNGDEHGVSLDQSFFLSDIQVQGMDFLTCWMRDRRESADPYDHFTPCDNCGRLGETYKSCEDGQREGFKREECFK